MYSLKNIQLTVVDEKTDEVVLLRDPNEAFLPTGPVENPDDFMHIKEFMHSKDMSSIENAMVEMKDTYKERLPYTLIPTMAGNCYAWTDIFIYACLMAMSTDALIQFTQDELEAWLNFVNFENYHSHSALDTDANGTAIGCTIPNAERESWIVAEGGTILTQKCQLPTFDVLNEQAWKSLDKAFMDLYRCGEIDDCKRLAQLQDVSTCELYTKRPVVHNGRAVKFDDKDVIFSGGKKYT